MSKKVLGKGLNSIFQDIGSPVINPTAGTALHSIKTDQIVPNPFQPRREFNEDEIQDLAKSIKEKGLLQPIVVRKHENIFQIIAGERRWRAQKSLGMLEIDAYVRDKVSDRDMMELSLIENIQRVQLSPIEEAMAYQNLMNQLGITHEEMASKLGKSRSSITNTLRLLSLPQEIQEHLKTGKLTSGHGKALLSLPSHEQINFARRILEEGLNVRESEKLPNKKTPLVNRTDPNLNQFVKEIQYFLDTRIGVKGTEKKGKLIIEYFKVEQLQKISKIIEAGYHHLKSNP